MTNETVKILFASGAEDLIPAAIAHLQALYPELPLYVVSEFPVSGARWLPFPVARGFWENLSRCRAAFHDKHIRLCAVMLQPKLPYWKMRLIAFTLAPWNFLAFNENLGHFMLRPRSAGTILRHLAWRMRNFLVWQLSPGGPLYTFGWRLGHPAAFRRPWLVVKARIAGRLVGLKRRFAGGIALQVHSAALPKGISVVIPSRNGKDLLAQSLPEVMRQLSEIGGEAIVVDNGSDDGTVEYLEQHWPAVLMEHSAAPLSFARAVNQGIRRANCERVCLLNNDMEIEPGFFLALLDAFVRTPDLFCATAQIFFPDGARREETGKAVMPPRSPKDTSAFPVRCEIPITGEDCTYVLYGSGGCSLYDTAKLRALGGLDEIYEPAYVEDLDLGLRGWQQAWPTVFAAGARVLHRHRATTSRYYSAEELDLVLESNYLRFLVRTVMEPATFKRLWREAVDRLNALGAGAAPYPAAVPALREAGGALAWIVKRPPALIADSEIFAIGSGAVSVWPGRGARAKPVVLVASPFVPFPLAHGGAVRMYNLMRRAAVDFDQVLVAFVESEQEAPPELREICVEVVLVRRSGSHSRPSTERPDIVEEFDSPAFHAAVRQSMRKWKPALAQLELTHMAQYAEDCRPARVILVEHDITLDLYQQLLLQGEDWELRRQLRRWTRFETAAWAQVDHVVTMSEKDRSTVQGAPAVCLPNGVDLQRFQPASTEPEPGRILFIGSFAHLPNVLAVDFFLREVWPLLSNATLHIIAGRQHQYYLDYYRDKVHVDLQRPGIEVEDFVADVRAAYACAEVVIAPLVASAGTNIKIMEAMAMGKAVVSTPAGINGLDLDDSVIVANTAPEMAAAIQALMSDPSARHALEQRARAKVERDFDWDAIAENQKHLYVGQAQPA
ncbi:MAG: glycosyltransferase [Acidobacteriota bacterium]|nr:glycosyltransferase [Acidobacteriota bacterium]